MEACGWRHSEVSQEGRDLGTELGGLADAYGAAGVFDDLDGIELRDEVAPGVLPAELGDALQQEGEHTELDVRLDAVRPPVVDGPHPQTGLHRAPALLDPHQLLVAEGQILSSQRGVIRGDDPLPIEALLLLDGSPVDAEEASLRLAQVASEALAREQLTGSLRVLLSSRRGHEGREFRLQQPEELLAVLLLPRVLQRVVADDVAVAARPVPDNNLVAAAHLAGQDVLPQPQRERVSVLLGVHPRVADEDALAELPALQVRLHAGDGRHIGGVAREY